MRSIRMGILFALVVGSVVGSVGTELAQSVPNGALPPSPTTAYKMSNGMEVILKENHSSPMVASVVFVRSGAKYEDDFNNGVTHFLEHLLFNGTATRTQEEISDRIKNLGGYINAFTRKELTAYMSLVPSEHMAEALDIQRDMLFNSIFPEDRFPKERKIVIEEIHKDNDNPEYVAERFHDQWAYRGSPYARPVLGYENLISTIPRQQVIDYYQSFYQPNNMILLVIGDFTTSAMRELLEDTFGRHPAQPIPPHPEIVVPPVRGRTIKRIQADVIETHVDFHLRLPQFTDPSYHAVALLTEILNERALSPLRERLTEGEIPLATNVTVSLETREEFTAMRISATVEEAEGADAVIEAIEGVLRGLPTLDVSQEDLNGIVTRLRVEDMFLREKLHYYAIIKAPMLVVTGYEFMDELPDMLSQVALSDIHTTASRYLTGEDYVATIVAPKSAEPEATVPSDVVRRSVYAKRTLSNGVSAIVKSNPDSRVFAINVLGKDRAACEPEGLIGISDFVNRMLTRGTQTRSADDIGRALNAMGAELTANDNPYIPYDDFYTTPQYTFIKFATIDEYAEQGTSLLAELLGQSVFPEEEVARTQIEVMGLLRMAAGSTRQTCQRLFRQSLFGDGPYAHPTLGTHESVMSFTSDALRRHLHTLYAPANMIVTCVTNLDSDSAIALLERTFGELPEGTPPRISVVNPAPPQGEVANHQPMEKEQVYIHIGGLLPRAADPDMPAIRVAGRILSSRLKEELREKEGLAYSVGASVNFDREFGWHTCTMGTGKANYARAKDGILAGIRRLREELPTEEEVEIARNSIWGSTLTRQLSRVNQAYYMCVHEFLGLGYDYSENMTGQIRAVRPADVQRVARAYFETENYVLTTVGSFE